MNIETYLQRINIEDQKISTDIKSLKYLQRQHLLNVPFENLDIHWGKTIKLDVRKFNTKIVEDKRGGFCYELNGLFNELLKAIGFTTRIVSCCVANKEGKFGAEYDHLAIIVDIKGEEYLVDVGFGGFTIEPLLIELGAEQQDSSGVYKVLKFEEYLEIQKKTTDGWKPQYTFKNLERELKEFDGMCVFNQTSPESHFTKGKLCSILTLDGRKTLTDKKFIILKDGVREEAEVKSNQEFCEVLKREFGIFLKKNRMRVFSDFNV